MAGEPLPDLTAECFFIAPIGAEGSETRDRSDGVMDYIVSPAAQAVGLTTVRADKIAKPGQITRQVIEHVVGAAAAVVDLTGANANVYYEMAVRHTAQLPTVLIAQDGEKLPFDISQMRTIFFDHTNLKSAAECSEQIKAHLQEALRGEVDSPIAASVSVQRLEHGSAQDRVLAQLVDGMDEIRGQMRRLAHRERDTNPAAVRDLIEASTELAHLALENRDDERVDAALRHLRKPLRYLTNGRHDPDLFEAVEHRDLRRRREVAREAWREEQREEVSPPDRAEVENSSHSEAVEMVGVDEDDANDA